MRTFDVLQELPKRDKRHKVRDRCWKNGTDTLAQHTVARNLQFVK